MWVSENVSHINAKLISEESNTFVSEHVAFPWETLHSRLKNICLVFLKSCILLRNFVFAHINIRFFCKSVVFHCISPRLTLHSLANWNIDVLPTSYYLYITKVLHWFSRERNTFASEPKSIEIQLQHPALIVWGEKTPRHFWNILARNVNVTTCFRRTFKHNIPLMSAKL